MPEDQQTETVSAPEKQLVCRRFETRGNLSAVDGDLLSQSGGDLVNDFNGTARTARGLAPSPFELKQSQ